MILRAPSHASVGTAALLILAAILHNPIVPVSGHGYLKTPRSRNLVAYEDGVWWPQLTTNPHPEAEPQSANIGGTDARCGVIAGTRNYDFPKNGMGGPLPPNPQACYPVGGEVELDVVLTAHHKGHFEFYGCAVGEGESPTQACFDAHPLTFLEDVLSPGETRAAAVPHPLYPMRAYIPDGDWELKYRYRLPPDLSGELVLIQWYYVTANSCTVEGHDTYDYPQGFHPKNVPECTYLSPNGVGGNPERFWNCAEVRIPTDGSCGTAPPPPPVTTTVATTTTQGPGTTTTTTTVADTTTIASPTPPPPPTNCPNTAGACSATATCESIGFPGMCCSQWGYCGTGPGYCGTCCQNGPCENGPSPPAPTPPSDGGDPPTSNPPPPPPTPIGFDYDADHGEDSRLIAYVGNWQTCPTAAQVDAYSHLVIAFAVSYTWSPGKNNCDSECNIASTVPICNNMNNQQLVDTWRAAGKKVILSFGGAGMGGSWSGDQNNCWDYCFGKEDELSTSLVNIIDSQNFDGIDIDYEYCYDVAGKQSGRCPQRTAAYSDLKAQTFLNDMTSMLRTKLDDLQDANGYDRGRYEVTHAPMDTDLTPNTSPYFQILHDRRADLDFLMPQFYNGVTRPAIDGVVGTGAGSLSGAAMFSSLSNELFDSEPHKVVFGHCISDCSGTGSNANAAQAVAITTDLKEYNDGEFACNGGAFFWVALHDAGGAWSDAVVAEVSKTAGCSHGGGPSTTTTEATTTEVTTTATDATTTEATTTDPATTAATTTAQTTTTTADATTDATTADPATTAATTTAQDTTTTVDATTTTEGPVTTTETTTTEATTTVEPTTTTEATTTTTTNDGELVINQEARCGTSELDAREHCSQTCSHSIDCPSGQHCWPAHPNYCGSFPQRTYTSPAQDTVPARCGPSEVYARTFCGTPCTTAADCDGGEPCWTVQTNYCGSAYTDVVDDGTTIATTTEATTATTEASEATTTMQTTTTTDSTTTEELTTTEATTTTTTLGQPVIDQQNRCGTSELDARENCRSTCAHSGDCPSGMWCWGVQVNYCGSIPQRVYDNPIQSTQWARCGVTELDARTFCGAPCTWQCPAGETCWGLHSNYCDSSYTEV